MRSTFFASQTSQNVLDDLFLVECFPRPQEPLEAPLRFYLNNPITVLH
jgi:hypothetical protein